MSDKKISQLDSSTVPLNGSEVLPIVQSGVTKQVTVDNLTAGKNVSLTGITITGTGGRIRGDFSNATQANRVMFQNSTTNAATPVGAIPNGTATQANFTAYNASDPTNASVARMSINTTTDMRLDSSITGTGTYLPLTMWTGGSERVRLDTSGIVTMSAYGAGAATFSASGVISSVSDETWKTKDGAPANPDEMIQKLEPGYWFYNEEKTPIFGADRQLGFYAQNVNEAIGNEAAPIPEEGKPWGYYDRSVLAVAVMSLKNALNSIKEQQATIETLQAEVALLKSK